MSVKETMDSRMERIESKIDRLTEIVEGHDKRFDAIDRRLEAGDKKFKSIDQRFKEIDQKFDAIDQKFDAIDQKFDRIDQRFDDLENKMELEFKAVRIEMQCESNRICNRIDGLDSRVHNLEIMAEEKWDVPDLKDHIKMVDRVIQKHSDQISVINERLGIMAV